MNCLFRLAMWTFHWHCDVNPQLAEAFGERAVCEEFFDVGWIPYFVGNSYVAEIHVDDFFCEEIQMLAGYRNPIVLLVWLLSLLLGFKKLSPVKSSWLLQNDARKVSIFHKVLRDSSLVQNLVGTKDIRLDFRIREQVWSKQWVPVRNVGGQESIVQPFTKVSQPSANAVQKCLRNA